MTGNLTENTLKAIKKIDKVRGDREVRHIKCRMKGNKAKEQKQEIKELEQGIVLVKAPFVLREDSSCTLPKIKVKVSQEHADENQLMENESSNLLGAPTLMLSCIKL
ncbi:Ribosomal protein L24e-related protein [Quillaja saponaria]|uniref:Ribosomal protein L24e-related protein n=1 Tax=Quillaja saponaria TaxID=32244 RepID=A0AAD7VD92_QUISA|nr:Ribosomal protein L24e-related protein [Quillaja saponaria]